MFTRKNLLVTVALSWLVIVDPTQAASIFISNFSFEEPPVGDGVTSTLTVSQAADTAIPGWGAYTPAGMTVGVREAKYATDGIQIAVVNGTGDGIYQDVGALLPNAIYTLAVSNLLIPNNRFASLGISLFNGPDPSAPLLGSFGVSSDDPVGDVIVTFPSPASASGDLTIFLFAVDDFGSEFDNVRLSATPEPSSCVLFGLGVIGLYAMVRRRTRS